MGYKVVCATTGSTAPSDFSPISQSHGVLPAEQMHMCVQSVCVCSTGCAVRRVWGCGRKQGVLLVLVQVYNQVNACC